MSIKTLVERFQSMVLRCPSGMTQSTLVETCRHNLPTSLLAQMRVAECRTWKQLVLQGEQMEEIVARVRAKEKNSKPRPNKPMRCTPESSSQPRRRDTPVIEVKSPSKAQSVRGGITPAKHVPINCAPLRMNMWSLCSSYFKRVIDSNYWRSDILKRQGRMMIPPTIYITQW